MLIIIIIQSSKSSIIIKPLNFHETNNTMCDMNDNHDLMNEEMKYIKNEI